MFTLVVEYPSGRGAENHTLSTRENADATFDYAVALAEEYRIPGMVTVSLLTEDGALIMRTAILDGRRCGTAVGPALKGMFL